MARALKLIQITDLHLRADPAAIVHGWHVERAWRRVAEHAMARHADADLWLLTGDLVEDASAAGYQRLNQQLATLPCPVLVLAGNHDDPAAMAAHMRDIHIHATIAIGGWRIHALNSHLGGTAAGRLGRLQLQGLQAALTARDDPSVVCVHHPPVSVNSCWLDAIGLQDRDALCSLVRSHAQVAAVVSGHAHQAMATRIGTSCCWITPSTMRQFLPNSDTFALDPRAAPGYRVVMLTKDGGARSTLQRLGAHRA